MTQEERESRPGVVEYYRQNPEELLEDLRKYLTRGRNDALLAHLLADLVKGSLLHLRAGMNKPEPAAVSWSSPCMELRVPVSWDFEKGGILHVHHQEGDGRPTLSVPLKTLEELKAVANPDPVAVLELLRSVYSPMGTRILALSGITGNVYTVRKKGETTGPLWLSPQAEEQDRACMAVLEEEEERATYLQALLDPFFFFWHPEINRHPERRGEEPVLTFRWTRTHEGKPQEYEVGVFCQAFPLVVDQDLRKAFFPIVVGLLTREGTDTAEPMDLGTWPEEEREALFTAILVGTSQWVAEAWQAPTPPPKPTPSEELVPAGPPSPERTKAVKATQTRYLLGGPTRIPREASILQAHAGDLKLPRKLSAFPEWDDLVKDEVDRLREQYGEDAFRDLRRETKDPNAHGKLLEKRRRVKGGEYVALTKEAEETLLATVGHKGFRRILRDKDGMSRKYLIKRFPVRGGSGYFEARLTWYGQAGFWVEETTEKARKDFEAQREELEQSLPLEGAERRDEELKKIEGHLRLLEAVRDARHVMGAILHAFGARGENPLRVPAWNLKTLLECEKDPHGFRRVRGCLRALQEIRFYLKAAGLGSGVSREIEGPFLGTVEYEAGGPGGHGDGDFYLNISPSFLGCFKVFQTTAYRIQDPEKVLHVYDWSKDITKEDRKALGDGGGYIKGVSAVAPYFDKAKGLSKHQSSLRQWIEANLTLRKDPARKGGPHVRVRPGHQKADTPRPFGRETCPLIPDGRSLFGALSHFPGGERGRTLAGTPTAPTQRSGGHKAGLLAAMGYTLPPGMAREKRRQIVRKAIGDLRAVVEDALGGLVAVKHGKAAWFSLQEAEKMPPEDLLGKGWTFWLFVAEDLVERYAREVEKYQQERHSRGEVPYLVGVTTDRTLADSKGEEYTTGEESTGLDALPLRLRLYAARKERGLSLDQVGALFGVSRKTAHWWEKGPEHVPLPRKGKAAKEEDKGKKKPRTRGKTIPPDVAPMLLRWIETGEPPTAEELAGLAARREVRPGVKKPGGEPG